MEVVYSSIYDNYKKNKHYDNTKSLSLKIIEEGTLKLGGEVTGTLTMDNSVTIDETIPDMILYSKLTEDQKNKIDNKWTSIKDRLKK